MLQKFLNAHGFVVAQTGAGSPGHETSFFGLATYRALKRFQTGQGLPATGFFGPLTRAALATFSTPTGNSPPPSPTSVSSTAPIAANNSACSAPPGLTCIPGTGIIQPYAPIGGYTPGFGGGRGGASASVSPTPDTSAPTVTLTAPLNGSVVSGSSVTISATASDNTAVTGVQFKVNGVNVGSEDTTSPYSISWDSTATSSGAKTVVAVARDAAGNYATSSSISITVDNTAPAISSISSGTPTTAGATITWTTDESSNSQVNYGTTVSYGTASSSATFATSHSIILTGLTSNTTYHFQIQSTDATGNVATSSDQTFATVATLPSGALGVWYADQYDASRNYVPNALSVSAISSNLLNAPRRLFSNSIFWPQSALTVVDNAATCPDGSMEASTVNGTGYFVISTSAYPAGTYTAAIWAKSNTGSDNQFKIEFFSGGASQIFTATQTWQRFALSGTNVGNILFTRSPDNGTTNVNLQICDAAIYSGSVDLGNVPLSGDMYFGKNKYSTTPTYASGAIDFSSSQAQAIAQLPSVTSFNNLTVIAIGSKVVNESANETIISSFDTAYTNFTSFFDQFNKPSFDFGGASFNGSTYKNLWDFYNQGWHAITTRYDGSSTSDVFLDDIHIGSASSTAITPPSIGNLAFGVANGFYGGYKVAAIGLWNRALSDSEIRAAYSLLSTRAALSGNTITPERIYVAEGDSITAGFGTSNGGYPTLFGSNSTPIVHGVNAGVSASQISDLTNRAVVEDGIIPPIKGNRKFILSVLIGANDLTGVSVSQFLTNLSTYLDARRAAGWTVVVGTILPTTRTAFGGGTFNTARNTANTTIRTWVGTHADAVADFAADPTIGPDAAAANTTYYQDGTHPTDVGQAILETVLRPVINGL